MRKQGNIVVLLMVSVAIAAVGLIGVTRGQTQRGQSTADQDNTVCDPIDCNSSVTDRIANCACKHSLVLIEFANKEIELTDAQHGVDFDLKGNGPPERISWTAADSGTAVLFYDRNLDHIVNNSAELFGNFTPQVPSPGVERNGMLALAMLDRQMFGGNNDGQLDIGDEGFLKLRLWIDSNHNGVSEPSELHTMAEYGVQEFSLLPRESMRRDQYGNLFRYQSDVYGPNKQKIGTAYDVILLEAN